jgi:hypothetical protein
MYLHDLIRSLLRRWYLVLFGLLLTAGLAWAAFQTIPVTYESRASMVLLPPKISTEPDGNPYLYLGGLGQALDVLTRSLDADAERERLEDAHPEATYEAIADTTTSGPIMLITSTASTPAGARNLTAAVLEAVPTVLSDLQTDLGVPVDSRITVMTLSVDTAATVDAKLRTQALGALIAAGVTLTILLTGLLDGLLRSRRSRPGRGRGTHVGDETAPKPAEAPAAPPDRSPASPDQSPDGSPDGSSSASSLATTPPAKTKPARPAESASAGRTPHRPATVRRARG